MFERAERLDKLLKRAPAAITHGVAGALRRLYSTLIEDDDDHGRGELSESALAEVPGNTAKLIGGFTLQKIGDRVADPKTTLAWLLTSLGAPGFAVGLLVPIRESGSLLPQALLVPFVRRFPYRSRVWTLGAVGQGLTIAGIGLAGLWLEGRALGVSVLLALALFALFRSASSITAKDVIGKTIPFGERGTVTGIAASIAGFAAVATGLAMAFLLQDAASTGLALVILGASLLWFGGGAVFLAVDEEPSRHEETEPRTSWSDSWGLLASDAPFRRFVIARSLMLVTALSPPFVVALSPGIEESSVSGVGPFVVATGIAGLVASPIWGRLADSSSRLVMASASATSSVVLIVFLLVRRGSSVGWWLGPLTYLLLAVAHAGARMGRKTYVVDLGDREQRTQYVAVSNSIIGVVLLGAGALSASLSGIGPEWTLAALAVFGIAGCVTALSMEEIHVG